MSLSIYDQLVPNSEVPVANLARRLADYFDDEGWESDKPKRNREGRRRRRIDDDHYVTVHLNARYLKPSAEFRPNMHQLKVGFTHEPVMDLLSQLFGDQGRANGFILADLQQFGAPRYIADAGYSSKHGTFMEFEDVLDLINNAHEEFVANHRGPEGMRAGVRKWNVPAGQPFKLLTVDAYLGWTTDATARLADLQTHLNFPTFHANLAEYLGYDPLNSPES